VVVAAGDIDLAVAPSLRESLAELLDAGHCDIVVDLIDATFLDSVALGVLVGALEQCRQAGGDLHLVVRPSYTASPRDNWSGEHVHDPQLT
jgi:anti-sigma B factor antagonist